MDDLLRRIQLVEYDILKELDKIAKNNNIRYYMGQGTLLGAVKYKKFIPWDDDIDLFIPYRDLKRLVKVFPEMADSKYIITNCFIEKHFPLAWSKIRNKNTLSRPYRYKDLPINWGICIDLFPVYSISNSALLRKLEHQLYRAANKMIYAEFTKYEEGHGLLVRALEKIPICLRHLFLRVVTGILDWHGDNTEYVLVASKEINIIKREKYFKEESFVEFEDGVFPAISNYEDYLTMNYGDWRAELPPHQQKGHDLILGDIEWSLQNT